MFIRLTKSKDDKPILVNTNHVKGFFSSHLKVDGSPCTDVEIEGGCVEVKETIEEIETMLTKLPEVPDVH